MNPFDEGPAGENFVGREAELAALEEALNTSSISGGGLLVVGLHGTGKSSLLEECAARCVTRSLLPVVCVMSAATGHQQIRTLLQAAVNELDRHSHDGLLLLDHWPGLVPEERLKEPRFQFHNADFLNDAALRHDMGLLTDRISAVGLRGIVFMCDEAQVTDPQALGVLRQVARRLPGSLFVLAVRVGATPEGPSAAGRDWLRQTIGRGADPGTDGFFSRAVGVGAFGEDEAHQCIARRLDGGPIVFDDDLVSAICALGDRVPREIIQLSRKVYDHCLDRRVKRAELRMLEPAFKFQYNSTIAEATQRLSGLSKFQKEVLRHLAVDGSPASAAEISATLVRAEGGATPEHTQTAAANTSAALYQIAQSCQAVIEREDGRYAIDSAIHRAAIRIALQMSLI